MFCRNCGQEIKDVNAAFCVHCGCAINTIELTATEPNTQEKAFCQYCGEEVNKNAVLCVHCGRLIKSEQPKKAQEIPKCLKIAIKILMIISCVFCFPFILSLAWNIPMTVSVFRKLKKGEKVGTGMNVCVLIFCNLIAGCLLFVSDTYAKNAAV